jgi:hypothetical protein
MSDHRRDRVPGGRQSHHGAATEEREAERLRSVDPVESEKREVRGEREEVPDLGPARLGDLEGVGLLTVVRDAAGGLIDANGSWREHEPTMTLEELKARLPAGSATTYEGPMVQQQFEGASDHVRVTAVVTRHGEYEDYEGTVIRLVNFVAHELD